MRVPDPAEDFIVRVDELSARLAALAEAPDTSVLTDPDPDMGERWDRGQVWAHLVEFVPYWMDQLRIVIDSESEEPVPFGRLKTDPGRIAAIEAERHDDVGAQWERLSSEIGDLKAFLTSMADEQWDRAGVHPTLGTMTVPQIVDRFLVAHVEEHLAQLQDLAGGRASDGPN